MVWACRRLSAAISVPNYRMLRAIRNAMRCPSNGGASLALEAGPLASAFTADIAAHRHWDRAAKGAMAA